MKNDAWKTLLFLVAASHGIERELHFMLRRYFPSQGRGREDMMGRTSALEEGKVF